jgi:hypothetical protein
MSRQGRIAIGVTAGLMALGLGAVLVRVVIHEMRGIEVVSAMNLKPNDCIRMPDGDQTRIDDVHRVGCDDTHDAQIYAVFPGVLDDDASNFAECLEAWDGADPVALSPPDARFSGLIEQHPGPTQSTVTVICLVELPDGLVGSLLNPAG